MMVGTYIILLILCAPILGIPTGNNITEVNCEKNDDCVSNNVCVDFKCEDPCLGGCGPNTICLSGDVIPVCACKPGFAGNPFNGCYPEGHIQECTINSDCPEEQACFNGHCKDVCDDACGLNSICKGIKHRPVCFCSPGHVWDEFFGCRIEKIKECNRDSDCTLNHTCIKDKYVSPCSGVCGQNTICCIRNHHASCACKDDYIGNPFNGCFYQNKIKLPKKYFIGGEKVR
ncbi:hypothetical protein J6590_044541 [Homalodisca vitripennis]|nr:hypothetical protein J6590_044541 [Homalodisca vitripennis]